MATGVKRQVAIVFDINKCMGCQTCTVACKMLWTNQKGMDHQWWMKVNTMPGRGSPKDWEKMGGGYDKQGKLVLGKCPSLEEFGQAWQFNHDNVFFQKDNKKAFVTPQSKPQWGPNWDEDIGAGEWPNAYFFYFPRLCNQCTHPPCVEACPQGALVKREKDGVVLISGDCQKTGVCQQECMKGCPYKVIYLNTETNKAQMCNFCLTRYDKGIAVACVRQCPGRAGRVDYLDNAEGTVAQLVHKWKVAVPLHPEFNTGPNVYYVPPLSAPRINEKGEFDLSQPRIPLEYQRSLFGPGVDAALKTLQEEMAKRRRGEGSELMDILISRNWRDLLGAFQTEPREAAVVGAGAPAPKAGQSGPPAAREPHDVTQHWQDNPAAGLTNP